MNPIALPECLTHGKAGHKGTQLVQAACSDAGSTMGHSSKGGSAQPMADCCSEPRELGL